jgi:pimeloyl-ACP methyl ester carboxylesterase
LKKTTQKHYERKIMMNTATEKIRVQLALNYRWLGAASLALVIGLGTPSIATAETVAVKSTKASSAFSDTVLVRSLPGFKSGYAEVNGIQLHYVAGGKGQPLVLLPGWPETWWEFHKIMPELAKHYHVIAVDLRGMGGSSRPRDGYDKKTMAEDIYQLVRLLGYDKAYIAGHDIGSMVAYSFAANHPEATQKLVLMDVPPADNGLMKWPLLPENGTFGDKIDENHAFAWWFAFHQVKGLPEKILAGGRIRLEQDTIFTYLLKDDSSIGSLDRNVYAAAYTSADAIRAGDAWYQAFPQDIIDDETYKKLEMPVLALAGPGYNWMNAVMTAKATDVKVVKIPDCGHFIPEEKPEVAVKYLVEFFKE